MTDQPSNTWDADPFGQGYSPTPSGLSTRYFSDIPSEAMGSAPAATPSISGFPDVEFVIPDKGAGNPNFDNSFGGATSYVSQYVNTNFDSQFGIGQPKSLFTLAGHDAETNTPGHLSFNVEKSYRDIGQVKTDAFLNDPINKQYIKEGHITLTGDGDTSAEKTGILDSVEGKDIVAGVFSLLSFATGLYFNLEQLKMYKDGVSEDRRRYELDRGEDNRRWDSRYGGTKADDSSGGGGGGLRGTGATFL
jgi:hypothetical protein